MKAAAIRLSIIGIILFSVFMAATVYVGGHPFVYSSYDMLPPRGVALVLGASLKKGRPSTMLADRLTTASDLYKRGIVKKLIVSGDNRREDYNEPEAMRKYLIEQGVPEEDIIPDYAGRRTYDSCYRLKHIFDQHEIIIVTQNFHLPRALYLCRHLDVDAIGIPADRARYHSLTEAYIREIFASVKAWLDIYILKPMPVLGNKEKVF